MPEDKRDIIKNILSEPTNIQMITRELAKASSQNIVIDWNAELKTAAEGSQYSRVNNIVKACKSVNIKLDVSSPFIKQAVDQAAQEEKAQASRDKLAAYCNTSVNNVPDSADKLVKFYEDNLKGKPPIERAKLLDKNSSYISPLLGSFDNLFGKQFLERVINDPAVVNSLKKNNPDFKLHYDNDPLKTLLAARQDIVAKLPKGFLDAEPSARLNMLMNKSLCAELAKGFANDPGFGQKFLRITLGNDPKLIQLAQTSSPLAYDLKVAASAPPVQAHVQTPAQPQVQAPVPSKAGDSLLHLLQTGNPEYNNQLKKELGIDFFAATPKERAEQLAGPAMKDKRATLNQFFLKDDKAKEYFANFIKTSLNNDGELLKKISLTSTAQTFLNPPTPATPSNVVPSNPPAAAPLNPPKPVTPTNVAPANSPAAAPLNPPKAASVVCRALDEQLKNINKKHDIAIKKVEIEISALKEDIKKLPPNQKDTIKAKENMLEEKQATLGMYQSAKDRDIDKLKAEYTKLRDDMAEKMKQKNEAAKVNSKSPQEKEAPVEPRRGPRA